MVEEETTNMEKGMNVPHSAREPSSLVKFVNYVTAEATFYRIHLAAFTFIPLIFSGIFYASNGRFHVSFVDSMFLCYSAMTVTGLSTVNLSTITAWQQVILYFLMMIGDFTIVSWIMLLIRKQFFKTHCEYVVAKRRKPSRMGSKASVIENISAPIATFKQREPVPPHDQEQRREEGSSSPSPQLNLLTPDVSLADINQQPQDFKNLSENTRITADARPFSSSPKTEALVLSPLSEPNPLSPPVIEFAMSTTIPPRVPVPRRGTTILSNNAPAVPGIPSLQKSKYRGFGGYPGPTELLDSILKIIAPRAHRKLERTMTLPSMTILHKSSVPWLNFSGLVVGRNSNFHTDSLTDEQLEDIGGAEYRALNMLSWLVPTYFVVCQLLALLLFLPWLSIIKTYNPVFQAQPRLVSKTWFSFFQVMAAYTGGGLSLVDLGMVPFQNAYLMIFALGFVIIAGNHALPIFLRLVIWISSKVLPEHSESQAALSFLLDHPRRCFLYLFPSHQTWFLVICLVLFSAIEWVGFLVLNIGLPAYESIPTGPRVIAGLFQSLAVRASGFSIVPLASLAPALLFLYVVMMYIAVYPVALSIRTTNVYEERSLGVFKPPPDEEDEEPAGLDQIHSRKERVGKYLRWHLRRQQSIDIWWLIWSVFLVAIIERKNLLDESKPWFDLFRVLFELVSAFAGIGLSLGFPDNNYSFAGTFSPLSKLVVIIVMVRGRHRGLPVAVDRAVLLPSELVVHHETNTTQTESEAENNTQPSEPPGAP